MPTAVSLTTLRARARERADMVGSSFVSDTATSLDAWINEGIQRLHEKLVDALGEEYRSSSSTFTTAGQATDYPLPADFFKLYGIDLNISGYIRTLMPYDRSERNAYKNIPPGTSIRSRWGPSAPRYSLVGSNIRLLPVPSDGLTGTIYYAPEATVLVSPSDTVSFPNGWERYVVLYAAAQALMKEESSVSDIMRTMDEISREIEATKEQRDLANPKRAVDLDLVDFELLF